MDAPAAALAAVSFPDALMLPVATSLAALPPGAGVGVAVSGGPDSVALAAVAALSARAHKRALTLFHVHHGLMAQADAWADGVMRLGEALGVPVQVRRVQVAQGARDGLEAAAREARYAALAEMAGQAGVADLLLAHHLDDQAETVLIRLLRGAGPAGLAAMRSRHERSGIRYHRPWLAVARALILPVAESTARRLAVPLADDPSNRDARHARGALRQRVLPAIAGHWPGYRQTLARFARRSAEAASVLDEVASADVASLAQTHPRFGVTLSLAGWRALSPARRALALRRWLADAGAPMPSEARLDDICQQFSQAAADRQLLVQHEQSRLRVYRGHILCEPTGEGNSRRRAHAGLAPGPADAVSPQAADDARAVDVTWSGQASVSVADLSGTLWFEPSDRGVDPAWLASAPLRLALRRGRERLRPAADRPSRSLKNLYQEAGIPAWERARLPLLWRGTTLVFAAGLGLDSRVPQVAGGIQLRWRADAPGATQGSRHDNSPRNAG